MEMELDGFFFKDLDGQKNRMFLPKGGLRFLYGPTGSGKSTILNGIGRGIRAAQGLGSPPAGRRGIGFLSQCGAAFRCDAGPLLEFDELLPQALDVAGRDLMGIPKEKHPDGSYFPPDEEELGQSVTIQSKVMPFDEKFLADWVLLVWVFARPWFRVRFRNQMRSFLTDLELLYTAGLRFVGEWETKNIEAGFIAEWNHFRLGTWLQATLDKPLDSQPSHYKKRSQLHQSDDPPELLPEERRQELEEGSENRLFARELLDELLMVGKLVATEGHGRTARRHGGNTWGALEPTWRFMVRCSDLSDAMQQRIEEFGIEDEEHWYQRGFETAIYNLQSKPKDDLVDVLVGMYEIAFDDINVLEGDLETGDEGCWSGAVNEFQLYKSPDVRLIDTANLNLLNTEELCVRFEEKLVAIHDLAYRDIYARYAGRTVQHELIDEAESWLPRIRLSDNDRRPAGESEEDRWLIASEDETGYRIRPSLRYVARMVGEQANELAPAFLTQYQSSSDNLVHRTIIFGLRKPSYWGRDQKRLFIGLRNEERTTAFEDLSSGEQRWVALILHLALEQRLASNYDFPRDSLPDRHSWTQADLSSDERRDFQEAYEDARTALIPKIREAEVVPVPSPAPHASTVLLLDEPEVHLDERNRVVVADWLYARTAGQAHATDLTVVAATHSLELLNQHLPHKAHQTAVTPNALGGISLFDIGDDYFEWLQHFGISLGTKEDAIFRAARGFLIVEGPQDKLVIEHFFAKELDAARVKMIAMMGTKQKDAVLTSEFLLTLGKPFVLFFDRIHQASDRITTPEMKIATWIKKEAGKKGVRCEKGGHHFPDIMATLPEEAVMRAFPDSKFTSWTDLINRYKEQTERENFKDFVAREMEWPSHRFDDKPISATEFIETVLAACEEKETPHGALRVGISEAMAFVSDS